MDKFLNDIVGLSFNIVVSSMLEKTPVISYLHRVEILGKQYTLDLVYKNDEDDEDKKLSSVYTDDWRYIFVTKSAMVSGPLFIGFIGDEETFRKDMALTRLVLAGEE